MKQIEIIAEIYDAFSSKVKDGRLPISLKPPALVGTVQDDPFDTWIGDEIKRAIPSLEVFHAGKLTTPDIVLRYKPSNAIIGLEVKKLIQHPNGKDPRGLTIDYNSCLP